MITVYDGHMPAFNGQREESSAVIIKVLSRLMRAGWTIMRYIWRCARDMMGKHGRNGLRRYEIVVQSL